MVQQPEMQLSLIHIYVTQTFSERTKNAVHKNVEIEIDLIQKRPDELAAMEFFEKMEAAFGYKLAVGSRKLNTDNINCMFEAVSYTHLDVYKRQGFWKSIFRMRDVQKTQT